MICRYSWGHRSPGFLREMDGETVWLGAGMRGKSGARMRIATQPCRRNVLFIIDAEDRSERMGVSLLVAKTSGALVRLQSRSEHRSAVCRSLSPSYLPISRRQMTSRWCLHLGQRNLVVERPFVL